MSFYGTRSVENPKFLAKLREQFVLQLERLKIQDDYFHQDAISVWKYLNQVQPDRWICSD
jgi:hypothetical protein